MNLPQTYTELMELIMETILSNADTGRVSASLYVPEALGSIASLVLREFNVSASLVPTEHEGVLWMQVWSEQ